MLNYLQNLLGSSGNTSYGHFYLWQLQLVGPHSISTWIALVGYFISVLLMYLLYRWKALAQSSSVQLAETQQELAKQIQERQQIEQTLIAVKAEQEQRLEARTAELHQANQQLSSKITEYQQVEVAFQEREQRLCTVLEAAHMGTWDWNIVTTQVTWSASLEKLFGLTPGSFMGNYDTFLDKLHPEDRDRVLQAKEQAIQAGSHYNSEFRILLPNGEVRWLASKGQVFYDETGNPARMVGVEIDITERKRIERRMWESNQMLQLVIENIPQSIFWKDCNSVYLGCNKVFAQSIGLDSATGLIGKTDYEIPAFTEADATAFRAVDQRVMRDNQPDIHILERQPTLDGKEVWVDRSKVPIYDAEGKVIGVLGTLEDVTQQKQAAEALRESEERFRSLSVCSPVGIFLTDTTGRCTYTNPRCQEITGLSLAVGQTIEWASSEGLGDRNPVASDQTACVEQEYSYSREISCQVAGNIRWVHVRSAPMLSDKGELLGYVGTVEDITERKRVEEEIQKALEKAKELSELKSRFVSMTSHEFRNPLATIMGSAELLEHYSSQWPEEKKRVFLGRIRSSVNRMTQLLDDVLLLGRAEAGKLELSPALLELQEFCQDLIKELEITYGHQYHFKILSHSCCKQAYLDEKLIRQMLNNLLSNAIKYSPVGSTIQLELACQNEPADATTYIVFRVQDWGIGIPPADQEHLFESFHRAKNVGTIPGTGLGLAIIKKAVDLHQGKIAFVSEVGVGTTFTIQIPFHPGASTYEHE